ncbi:MAG: alkyldihydroxyacetonephosphate synthase, partial [Thermoleophilaceae bacterium]|nr:alkyldihydroxyacetonephosphate synthase [Thermoleophilaceae bacterium]
LPAPVAEALRAAVGAENVRADRADRVTHAAGKSYPDLMRLRSGDGSGAPDAVVLPGSASELRAVLDACTSHGVAAVPFGGGTSVVGGVEPLRGGFDSVVTLDLGRIDGLSVDRRSLLASFGAGLRAPAAEARLNGRGLTLGHFPQSYELASIGGYVATRSAGQASTGYGRIDELVRGVRLVAPAGELVVKPFPASAAGPALRELVVGSEGTLGVIAEATLAVRPLPSARVYEGWSFRSFEEGAEAFRTLEQAHASPDVARLSDEEETRLALALSSSGSLAERLGLGYLRARGHSGGCLVICGFEGSADSVASRARRARAVLARHGGLRLGARPGESWLRGRYNAPYLRDELLDRGVMVETLETAATWTDLHRVHATVTDALRRALAGRGTPALVGCHVSHLYPSGASLYFTWIARQERGAELDQWRAAKRAATDAIVASGGTLTHHHAVGRDHAPWLPAEIGDLGVAALRAAKRELDPAGIMNPGKLLP